MWVMVFVRFRYTTALLARLSPLAVLTMFTLSNIDTFNFSSTPKLYGKKTRVRIKVEV